MVATGMIKKKTFKGLKNGNNIQRLKKRKKHLKAQKKTLKIRE